MKIRNTPLLFFICLSLTLVSCDNGESDSSINNLSEFAKEFVSTHIGSSNSINMENETPFSQLIQNLLGAMLLILTAWSVKHVMERLMKIVDYTRSILYHPHVISDLLK